MADLKLEITEGDVSNAIAVALAESFTPEKRDELLRDIVRAHLTQKENTYDKETLLSKRIGAIVRGIAVEQLEQKLESWRPEIEAIVSESVGDPFKESVFTSLKSALKRIGVVNLNVSAAIEDEL